MTFRSSAVEAQAGVVVRHVWSVDGASDLVVPGDRFPTLTETGRPGGNMGLREPWAVVASTPRRVAASVSPSFVGGLFWARSKGGLVFADSVRGLLDRVGGRVALDPSFIKGFAVLDRNMAATRTGFDGIGRIQPGTTMIWDVEPTLQLGRATAPGWGARPRTVVWCGPEAWPEPYLQGPETPKTYLEQFDACVDDLVDAGPLVVLMSGGLDSTFLAASLVRHATPGRPVHALCHSPHPGAELSTQGRWDPDDYPVAKLMEDAYPGRIVVHRLIAPTGATPLDAAADAANASGVPTLNPGNQVWMTHAAELAATIGATRVFCGTNGNPAYSYGHPYASAYYLARGQWPDAWRSLLVDGARLPSSSSLRGNAIRPLAAAARRRLPQISRHQPGDYRGLVGLGHTGPSPRAQTMTRQHYLDWLTGHGPYSAGLMFAGSPLPFLDPFATRRMLDTAAAITPLEWQRGPGPSRSYARLLAAGRVPDAIRLRTRRGGQAWDEWYLMRNEQSRYFNEVDALAETPILGGWVDDRTLRNILNTWPWGQVHGPARTSVLAMNRILALAAYVRAASHWTA